MPQENVEIVRRVYAAVTRRDWAEGRDPITDFAEDYMGHCWTVREGVIVAMESFPEPERALEAMRRGSRGRPSRLR